MSDRLDLFRIDFLIYGLYFVLHGASFPITLCDNVEMGGETLLRTTSLILVLRNFSMDGLYVLRKSRGLLVVRGLDQAFKVCLFNLR